MNRNTVLPNLSLQNRRFTRSERIILHVELGRCHRGDVPVTLIKSSYNATTQHIPIVRRVHVDDVVVDADAAVGVVGCQGVDEIAGEGRRIWHHREVADGDVVESVFGQMDGSQD